MRRLSDGEACRRMCVSRAGRLCAGEEGRWARKLLTVVCNLVLRCTLILICPTNEGADEGGEGYGKWRKISRVGASEVEKKKVIASLRTKKMVDSIGSIDSMYNSMIVYGIA